MESASGHALASPTIKGRLRHRPNPAILRARSILLSIPALVLPLAAAAFLLSLVFHEGAGLVLTIWPAYIVSAIAYVAVRGFRDSRLWALALAVVVGLILVGAALYLILTVLNAPIAGSGVPAVGVPTGSPAASSLVASPAASPSVASPAAGSTAGTGAGAGTTTPPGSIDGNTAFGIYTLAGFFLVLGLPLLWYLFRGRAWFMSREGTTIKTADAIIAEAGELSPIATSPTIAASPIQTQATTVERVAGEPLLSVRGLKKHFPILGGVLRRNIGTIYAVDGVDFDVAPGEAFGFLGPNGAGKT
ncbi:MAG TPA: hypothetical protein VGQ85_10060, partial [Candidatus Limnocylindrales bacterium]|nr:hypothetical protein [Candidatus Limnocylindrales bacterium]